MSKFLYFIFCSVVIIILANLGYYYFIILTVLISIFFGMLCPFFTGIFPTPFDAPGRGHNYDLSTGQRVRQIKGLRARIISVIMSILLLLFTYPFFGLNDLLPHNLTLGNSLTILIGMFLGIYLYVKSYRSI